MVGRGMQREEEVEGIPTALCSLCYFAYHW